MIDKNSSENENVKNPSVALTIGEKSKTQLQNIHNTHFNKNSQPQIKVKTEIKEKKNNKLSASADC